jgi:hypothetical protein
MSCQLSIKDINPPVFFSDPIDVFVQVDVYFKEPVPAPAPPQTPPPPPPPPKK